MHQHTSTIATHRTHPIVKWVGGKSRLLPELIKRVPAKFGRYYEGFSIDRVHRSGSINSDPSKRGRVAALLISSKLEIGK